MAEILVVEDEECISLMIKQMLEMDGHSVQVAANGKEALALLGPGRRPAGRRLPSLILTDVLLPFVDGYALTKHLGKSVRLREIPVIVVTARHDLREVCLSLSNVVDFIAKPFLPGELQGAVNYHAA